MICASLQTETMDCPNIRQFVVNPSDVGCSIWISIRAESVKWLQVAWFGFCSNTGEHLGEFIFLKDIYKGHNSTVTSGTL